MEFETAVKVLELLVESNTRLNAAVAVVRDECPENEFIEFRANVTQIMGSVFFDLMRPIHKAHPALEPEQVKAGIEQGRSDAENERLGKP